MRKYKYVLSFVAMIVVAIASYYIVEKVAREKNQLNFSIETVSGDKGVLSDFEMEGTITDQNDMHQSFYLADAKTTYYDLNGFYSGRESEYRKYFEEYRSFMRSKLNENFELIDEGDEIITAYTTEAYHSQNFNLKEANLHVETLNKENNKEEKFIVPLSTKGIDYYWIGQMYKDEDSLSVLLSAYQMHGVELHKVVQIDLNTGKKEISDLLELNNEDYNYLSSQPFNQTGGARYLFMDLEEAKNNPKRRFELYDLKTLKQLEMDKDLEIGFGHGTNIVYVKDPFLYYVEYNEEADQSLLKKYNIFDKKIVQEIDLSEFHQSGFVGPEAFQMKYAEGKIIIYHWNIDVKKETDLRDARIQVIDEETFETVFTGHLTSKNDKKQLQPFELYLH